MPTSLYDSRYQALRAQLIDLRKTARLTQVNLAERLGVGQSYVSKVERGETYVEFWLFADWCRACGASAATVMAQLSGERVQQL